MHINIFVLCYTLKFIYIYKIYIYTYKHLCSLVYAEIYIYVIYIYTYKHLYTLIYAEFYIYIIYIYIHINIYVLWYTLKFFRRICKSELKS